MAPDKMQVLLDTGRAEDAYACGYDKRMPVEMGGLKLSFEADRDLGPCITLNGPDGEIRLIGHSEVVCVLRAFDRALGLNARASAQLMAAE